MRREGRTGEGTEIGRERENMQRPGVLWAHTIGEFKAQEETQQVAQMINYGKPPRSLKQKSLNGESGLALYAVVWLAMCLSEMAIFEVDGIKA